MPIWSAEIKELETLYNSITGRFPGLEKELEQLIKTGDANVVMLYSRRCLEVVIADLCEHELKRPRGTEPLKGIIDKLSHEKKVPSNIAASMEGLNTLSTFGTHPKDFDPEQVKPVLNNLKTILKWYLKYKSEKSEAEESSKLQDASYKLQGSGKREKGVESQEGRPIELNESIKGSKKRVIFLFSGILLSVAIIIVALFIFNVIGGRKETSETEKSIAVLPFENMSDNEEYSWFGDAMTDEIIMQLYKIKKFVVRSRTSVMQYKGTVKTIPVIGKELKVNYLIEGSAQRIEDRVRIRVQLINATTDDHLWGDTFEGEWKDILSLQSDIAEHIATKLEVILSPEEIANIHKKSTENLEAYNLYLVGMHYYNNYSHDSDFWKAIEYFRYALDKDSIFALAYAGLADTYYLLSYFNLLPPNEALPIVKVNAIKAIDLNEKLANAHCALGNVKLWYDYKPDDAEKEFVRALEINPNSSSAHLYYSLYLSLRGRHDEAISQANYSLELDPLSKLTKMHKITILFRAGSQNQALQLAENARDSDPTWFNWYWICAAFYTELGMYKEAVSMIETELSLMGNDNMSDELGLLGYLYGRMGNKDKAYEQLSRLDELSSKGIYITNASRYLIFLGLGDFDKAMEFFEKSFHEHTLYLFTFNIKTSPVYAPLRNNPHFNELVVKIGL
jgi:TolB-like protein/Tfp pilus assembly protein PilF